MSYLLRIKSQVNDVFSEFRKYIAPTYFHDRCERSLQMHLYVMHKREILMALSAFLSTFILLLFIGLAGPSVTKQDTIRASEIFKQDKINATTASRIIANGPFSITTPSLSTYSQQLCLFLILHLKNEEASETFNKDIGIRINIDGIPDSGMPASASNIISDTGGASGSTSTRSYQLNCSNGKKCDPIEVFHLAFLEFPHYRVSISFSKLDSVHSKYVIDDITFSFQSINVSFTTLSIWFRFFFLVTSLVVTCWFTHALHRYSFTEWSLEQKWITLLLCLLLTFDNPFYPMQFLFASSLPRLMEIFFQSTLLNALLLFWLCFFHGIRQSSRPLTTFYAPKIILVGFMWFIMFYVMSWSSTNKLINPVFDEVNHLNQSSLLYSFNLIFYFLLAIYFIHLAFLVLSAFTELRSMPYFDLRLKLQTFLLTFVLTISVLVVLLSSSSDNFNNVSSSRVPFLQLLPSTFQSSSSTAFLSLFSILNLYICISAYFYMPSLNTIIDSRVVRDNPTLSMINDSDEDVIYGSDVEEPLTHMNGSTTKLIDTKNEDDEEDSE